MFCLLCVLVPFYIQFNGRSRPSSISSSSSVGPATIQHPAFIGGVGPLPHMPTRPRTPGGSTPHHNGHHSPAAGTPHSQIVHSPVDHRPVHQVTPAVGGPPDPPTRFEIQRLIGKHAVLLSWNIPRMDELAHSNGTTVRGYVVRWLNTHTPLL